MALLLFHKIQGFLDLVEDRQGEEVYLGEPSVGGAVLVPVHDVATFNGALPYGHHLRYGGVAEDHAPHVLAQAPGGVHKLGGQGQEITPAGGLHLLPEGGELQHLTLQVLGVVGVKLPGQHP